MRKEDKIQQDFVKWLEPYYLEEVINYTAIPNSTPTSIVQAVKNTTMGLKPGLLDMFFVIGQDVFFIELKAQGGILSKFQSKWIKSLKKTPVKTYVCFSLDECIAVIQSYLNKS